MTATILDLRGEKAIAANESFYLPVIIRRPSGGAVIDLTTATFCAQIRRGYGEDAPLLATFQVTKPDPTNGGALLQLSAAVTKGLDDEWASDSNNWRWDLRMVLGAYAYRCFKGGVDVDRYVTDC